MLIALHKNARTTPAVRAEIAASYFTKETKKCKVKFPRARNYNPSQMRKGTRAAGIHARIPIMNAAYRAIS